MVRIWKFGANVNTDQIVPGRYAPYVTSEAQLGQNAFIEARPEFAREIQPGDLLVCGPNFGCGSSREYAPRALKLAGVGAIFAPLFARIFYRNALNLGLPLFEYDLNWLEDGEVVEWDLERCELTHSAGTERLAQPSLFVREIWNSGGLLPYYRTHGCLPAEALR